MIAEVALSLVLLVGASLFVRSFLNLQGADTGFDTAPITTVRIFMTGDAMARPLIEEYDLVVLEPKDVLRL